MTPIRTCVVCRERRDDTELIRAGRDAEGTWYLGRGDGRGVWWCADSVCGEALRSGHVARALRKAVSAKDMEELAAVMLGRQLGSVVKE